MNKLIMIFTIVDVMVALLLIAVILVQQSKDGGFGGAPFGGVGESVFGGQAADHLTKLTVVLTAMFFIVTLGLAIITGQRSIGERSVVESSESNIETMITAPVKKKDIDEKKTIKTDLKETSGKTIMPISKEVPTSDNK